MKLPGGKKAKQPDWRDRYAAKKAAEERAAASAPKPVPSSAADATEPIQPGEPGAAASGELGAPSAVAPGTPVAAGPITPAAAAATKQVKVRRVRMRRRTTPRRRKRTKTLNLNKWSRDRRRITLIVSASISAIVVLFLLMAVAMGSAVRQSQGCASCHEMIPYLNAHGESAHAPVACASCHARYGALGLVSDGMRMAGWVLATPFVERPKPAEVSDVRCRRCHSSSLQSTTVAHGIRVKHKDFSETNCLLCHSGSAHTVKNRWYVGPQMQDCMTCHRGTISNAGTCDTCHVKGTAGERLALRSFWQSSHGTGWQKAHGMGELDTCRTCHLQNFCVECHGVPMPHQVNWPEVHGLAAKSSPALRERCATCHTKDWCTSCHGVEMPHPIGFLPQHPALALKVTREPCYKCHDQGACEACHYQSGHPNIPGIGMVHGTTGSSTPSTSGANSPGAGDGGIQ